MNILIHLGEVLSQFYEDERKHWEEDERPKKHIFLVLEKIGKFVNKQYQVVVFVRGGSVEQVFDNDLKILIVDMDNLEEDDLCPACRTRLEGFKCSFCKVDWSDWSYQQIVDKLNS